MEHLFVRCFIRHDVLHRLINDFNLSAQRCGMGSVLVLIITLINLPHGPFGTGIFSRQISEAGEKFLQMDATEQSRRLRKHEVAILRDRGKNLTDVFRDDMLSFAGEASRISAERQRLSRWFAWRTACGKVLPVWSSLLLLLEIIKGETAGRDVDGKSEEQDKLQMDSKRFSKEDLFKKYRNAMVVCMKILRDEFTRSRARVIYIVSTPTYAAYKRVASFGSEEQSLSWFQTLSRDAFTEARDILKIFASGQVKQFPSKTCPPLRMGEGCKRRGNLAYPSRPPAAPDL